MVVHVSLVWSYFSSPSSCTLYILSDHNFEIVTMVKGYEGPGEYKGVLVYRDPYGKKISQAQLISLVDASADCHQHISWNCSSTVFNAQEEGGRYRLTYWTNRYEEEMTYWLVIVCLATFQINA